MGSLTLKQIYEIVKVISSGLNLEDVFCEVHKYKKFTWEKDEVALRIWKRDTYEVEIAHASMRFPCNLQHLDRHCFIKLLSDTLILIAGDISDYAHLAFQSYVVKEFKLEPMFK